MFPLSPTAWVAVGGALLIAALGAGVKIQTSRLDACKAEAAAFVATVKAEGEAAAAEAKRVEAAHKRAMEKANAKYAKLATDSAATIKRLRRDNPPQSRLPEAPANSNRPDLLCLDRAEYQRENGKLIENLFAGARSLADEGTTNTLKLSTAQEWAASLAR